MCAEVSVITVRKENQGKFARCFYAFCCCWEVLSAESLPYPRAGMTD